MLRPRARRKMALKNVVRVGRLLRGMVSWGW